MIMKEPIWIRSFLINLDKDKERLAFFSKNFNRLNLVFERISAIDGKDFLEQDYQNFIQLRPRNNQTWSRGQMGCFLSHFNVWQLIADGPDEFCAVFEDDVHISNDLKHILQNTNWIPNTADIIRLETSTNRILLNTTPLLQQNTRAVYEVMSTSWNAGAYILSRKAAQKLIELPVAVHQPADILLFNFSESFLVSQLQILQFYPALCTQDKHHINSNNQFTSNIEFNDDSTNHLFTFIKKYNPSNIWKSIFKTLQGYKRIRFQ